MPIDPILRQPAVSPLSRRLTSVTFRAAVPVSLHPAGGESAVPSQPAAVTPPPVVDSSEIEHRALAQAQRMLAAEREAMLNAAREQGYARGLEQGKDAAARKAEEQAQAWARLMACCEARLAQEVAASESAALQIAVEAMHRLLGPGLDAVQMQGLVAEAAREIKTSGVLIVRLAPGDVERLRLAGIGDADLLPTRAGVVIRADSTIESGGCIMETEHGMLDARLEVQLQALLAVLRETYQARLGGHPGGQHG